MLNTLGVNTLDELVNSIVPSSIRLKEPLSIENAPRGEDQVLKDLKKIGKNNRHHMRSFIGMGYHNTLTPNVILRNVTENPAWYTPYTPYQAEVAQGRLESLLYFQTMVSDLTKLEWANASLLDEGTSAAEAMAMAHSKHNKKRNVFFVSSQCHPQTIDVIKTRAEPLQVTVVVGNHRTFDPLQHQDTLFGALLPYPCTDGVVEQFKDLVAKIKVNGAVPMCATDLLALTILEPPGEVGFEIALGNSQRFGVPLGFGGPHAAFFAVSDSLKRLMPGRIIGVSRDSQGKRALRMALQTREQHIRREKATSNICTAQALLSNMAVMYAIYHGPQGLKEIAEKVHYKAKLLSAGLNSLNYNVSSEPFFDTVKLTTGEDTQALCSHLEFNGFNVRNLNNTHVTISLDETTTEEDLQGLLSAFASFGSRAGVKLDIDSLKVSKDIIGAQARKSEYLTHPVFNSYHSEHEMLRYLYRLQLKDIGLTTSMIPLGSCTMKLNATTEMIPVTWPEFNSIHPFVPPSQAEGYKKLLMDLEKDLAKVTGFDAVSLQPNAGSQGEYAGLLCIRKYHQSRGDSKRNVCLIPVSAHGTNPASAVMCGMKVVVVDCDKDGNVDVDDLMAKASKHKDVLAALMVTYPSTHGVFEESIQTICKIIHDHGGQVYMDGANMNAQVGFTSPAMIGADVCHLNLHKTFCIPHGGGGPGMGPIGVKAHLAPFLPSHPVVPACNPHPEALGAVSAAPWGSASILLISWTYIKMMGGDGLTRATAVALLNANYMAKRLEKDYSILFRGKSGLVAHEFIVDLRGFKKSGIEAEDVAKRLMDFGFHAPTLSFPVAGTLMIEPTESESKAELDRFCDALLKIREEIRDIEEGRIKAEDSPLVHAPHPQSVVISSTWDRKYTREQAVYPLPFVQKNKWWPTVGRVDNVFGDRNLVCTCPPTEEYAEL